MHSGIAALCKCSLQVFLFNFLHLWDFFHKLGPRGILRVLIKCDVENIGIAPEYPAYLSLNLISLVLNVCCLLESC